MIYVIFDDSYEWDDFMSNGGKIVFIGTDKEAALAYFDRFFGDTKQYDASKWCYRYVLCEYPDGWNKHDPKTGDWREDKVNIIRDIDNMPDNEKGEDM